MKRISKISRVVTPIDFSDNSRLIADSAAFMAGKFGAEFHLVFVVQNFEDYSGFFVPQMHIPNLEDELMSGAEERMAKFIEEYKDSYLEKGTTQVINRVLMGDVAEQIVDYSSEVKADLIIMGTHGYKGLEKIMFGSVADKVVRSALCPVTTINPYSCCTWDED
ncbi:MAG: universal stress protein [Desulfobulbaceae bacterium]|nr:MAG: universal stress protein [Desulfobulbaceae bacterium]